jgi:hypothetical protein
MKIRSWFVSNSSSSSFIAVGVEFPKDQMYDVLKKLVKFTDDDILCDERSRKEYFELKTEDERTEYIHEVIDELVYDRCDYTIMRHDEHGYQGKDFVVSKDIAETSDSSYFDSGELSLDIDAKEYNDIKEVCDMFDIDYEKIKIFYGTRCC